MVELLLFVQTVQMDGQLLRFKMAEVGLKLDIMSDNRIEDEYKKWEPLINIPTILYCEGIHDDCEGFRILLSEESNARYILRIKFDFVRIFRKADEGDLMRTIAARPAIGESTLFLVENSSLIKWFHDETFSIHTKRNIKHFAIYTPNDCIDVLSDVDPIVEWLNP